MRITIRLDAQLHEEAKAAAKEEQQTFSAFIEGSLRDALKSLPRPGHEISLESFTSRDLRSSANPDNPAS